MSLNVAFIGGGYVGLVNGIGMASRGANVWIVEHDLSKLKNLTMDKLTIHEEGLSETLSKCRERVSFTNDLEGTLKKVDYVFIAVGTPTRQDTHTGESDLTAVYAVAREIGRYADHNMIVVVKSTVPVGTTEKVAEIIEDVIGDRRINYIRTQKDKDPKKLTSDPIMTLSVGVADNPEFLKEGCALEDFNNPSRIVLGVHPKDTETLEGLLKLYTELGFPEEIIKICDIRSAELIKYASNSMLAMKITFANMIAEFCDRIGANVEDVLEMVGKDPRIGSEFLKPGCGYGGSCFPKDVLSLRHQMENVHMTPRLLTATKDTNYEVMHHPVQIARILPDIADKTITILGYAFKQGTDDIRESPSLYLMRHVGTIQDKGDGNGIKQVYPKFRVYDVLGKNNLKAWLKENPDINRETEICDSVLEACAGADIVFVMNPIPEYKHLDWKLIRKVMRGNYIYDARNYFDAKDIIAIADAGLIYDDFGRNYDWLHARIRNVVKENLIKPIDPCK